VRVLVVNAGSSSLKLALLGERDETVAARELTARRSRFDPGELAQALQSELGDADAIGHRIVHGGERYREAVLINAAVERDLRGLADLAPLHQRKSLEALDAVSEQLPDLPAVACFDTAFHATLPPAARTYALPARWRDRLGVRRYGFHGLSHAWVARRAPQLLEREPGGGLRIVSCHLGAGSSLCAIRDGESLDTTMGFTPLEGLVMATRSGSIDPGALLWLAEREHIPVSELAHALEHESGLLGLSGHADMRELVDAIGAGQQEPRLAFEVYIHRLRGGIAAMAAALGGLDVLVFTGGVGEHSSAVREQTGDGLGFLGVGIDGHRSRRQAPDCDISAPGAEVATLVLSAREDREVARQVRAALGAPAAQPPTDGLS
jgi:acetate kinase